MSALSEFYIEHEPGGHRVVLTCGSEGCHWRMPVMYCALELLINHAHEHWTKEHSTPPERGQAWPWEGR